MNQGYRASRPGNEKAPFITGINYWPANKAMYWWRNFEAGEVEADFKRLAQANFRLVRIFLTWEDFQPAPDRISSCCLDNLKKTADLASACRLWLMPTFFCGHMSGINWMPEWMLAPGEGSGRFPVFSNNRLTWTRLRNCYADPEVIAAQCLQTSTVAGELKDHAAIFAYDLGNEASNWVIPPGRQEARDWLTTMTSSIKQFHPDIKVTLGMHAEDLEDDRNLWPQDASTACDFLSMHGYPFYISWMEDRLDAELVPFLGIITAWLGQKPVLFGEFGVPTRPVIAPRSSADYENHCRCPLWPEAQGAYYFDQVLQRLQEIGMMGAMAWCYADYAPLLWESPPLDEYRHERHFGMFRHDGTAKPAVAAFKSIKNSTGRNGCISVPISPWLPNSEERDNFYCHPMHNLSMLYLKYKEWLKNR